jgi:hypothetical protein
MLWSSASNNRSFFMACSLPPRVPWGADSTRIPSWRSRCRYPVHHAPIEDAQNTAITFTILSAVRSFEASLYNLTSESCGMSASDGVLALCFLGQHMAARQPNTYRLGAGRFVYAVFDKRGNGIRLIAAGRCANQGQMGGEKREDGRAASQERRCLLEQQIIRTMVARVEEELTVSL